MINKICIFKGERGIVFRGDRLYDFENERNVLGGCLLSWLWFVGVKGKFRVLMVLVCLFEKLKLKFFRKFGDNMLWYVNSENVSVIFVLLYKI